MGLSTAVRLSISHEVYLSTRFWRQIGDRLRDVLVVVKQDIPFTDFPEGMFKMYLIDRILLLPSEY